MSQLMGMDKSAISRGASFLQTKKFIKSRAGFGRNLEFGLTAKGHEIHDRIIRLALARQDALLSGLSKKDVSVLISHLHVLLGNLPSVDAIENREY
jgi:DNA-binding MarR family transcriptional regulator